MPRIVTENEAVDEAEDESDRRYVVRSKKARERQKQR